MQSHSVYITSTLRHLLIAVALAARDAAARVNHLIIVSHEPTDVVQRYIALLRDWPGSPFASVEVADADYRRRVTEVPAPLLPLARARAKARLRRDSRRLLDDRLRAWRPDRVYVGADDYFETEYALYLSQRLVPGAVGIYMEDGSVAYEPSYRRRGRVHWHWLGHVKAAWKKVTFGRWFEFVPVTGTHSRIGVAYVAFPAHVIPELRARELRTLTPALMHHPVALEFVHRMLATFGVEREALDRFEVLVLFAHSLVTDVLPGYAAGMHALCARLVARGLRVAAKYHPRELAPDPIGLSDVSGLELLPRNVPMEAMLLAAGSTSALTIIAPSTALLSTRWLAPDARVIGFAPAGQSRSPAAGYLHPLCRALAIPIEEDVDALLAAHFPGATEHEHGGRDADRRHPEHV